LFGISSIPNAGSAASPSENIFMTKSNILLGVVRLFSRNTREKWFEKTVNHFRTESVIFQYSKA
jgi:hypothetical protein